MATTKFSARQIRAYHAVTGYWPQEIAGLRRIVAGRGVNRYDLVGVYDGNESDLDTFAGRWQTVCEHHASICSHKTLALANQFAAAPEEWCEPCQARQS